MSLACAALAEECGIAARVQVSGTWLGKTPTGAAELCARLLSVRTVKLVRMDPFHEVKIELAAFNSKGVCIAWNDEPYLLAFGKLDQRGSILLDAASKRALNEVAKKGRRRSGESKSPESKRPESKSSKSKSPKSKSPKRKLVSIAALRPSFEARFAELAQQGAHFEHLRFGKPASKSSLDKIESKVLGGPLDPHLRSFFEEMDGLQCCYWIDPLSEQVSRNTPKPRLKKRLSWEESLDDGSKLWLRIDGLVQAWEEAGRPAREDGEKFVLGLINIPDHKTMFNTSWGDMLCLESGEYLFDAHHHYRGEYLEYSFDADTGKQESLVVSATDSFAARYDGGSTKVASYLKSLVKRAGRIAW
ncbi:MAG: hypothetical protein ACI9KE_005322 [Polyangiales bacterium]|jgi:hypothetical protein